MPSPGRLLSTPKPSVMLASGPQVAERSGFGFASTSSMPPPPIAASACADASRPMPPPSQCGQNRAPAATMRRASGTPLLNPPHFAISGWTTFSAPAASAASKLCIAGEVLAGRERNARALAQRLPFGPGPVRAQRLLEPADVERLERRSHVDRVVERPRLVGIDHQVDVVAQRAAHRGDVREIALAAETDLELERAKALVAARRGELGRTIGIEAARIDAHARRRAAQQAPQRLLRAARLQIPQRDVDAGDRLRERPRFAGLQREHRGRLPSGSRTRSADRRTVGSSASGASTPCTSRARCSAPTAGKLHQISPQPATPCVSSARTSTIGRSCIVPNDVTTGVFSG